MAIIAFEIADHDEANNSVTYRIIIENFHQKKNSTRWGVRAKSQPFTINWTTFSISLFISGRDPYENSFVIELNNEDNWKVKANLGIEVRIPDQRFYPAQPIPYNLLNAYSSVEVGSLPHELCDQICAIVGDGTLAIIVTVQVTDEMVCGGTSRIIQKFEDVSRELRETKSRLGNLENQLMIMNRSMLNLMTLSLSTVKNVPEAVVAGESRKRKLSEEGEVESSDTEGDSPKEKKKKEL